MKSSVKKFRKLKNSAAQKHQNKITSQDCNGKGKSIRSQPIAPKGLTSKQLDIDDTESDYSEISDLSDLIGSTIYPSERDPLTDPQIEPSDFSEPSCTSSRIEESKTGSGKPLKQAETSRITKKSGKNKGPSNYSYVQPRGADGPHSKNFTSREEKKIAQPRGAKKGRNGKKPGFKNKKIFKKKIVNSDDSSSSDDALNQATENIIQSKPARTKKQPPPVESGLVTFGQSPTNEENDPEEDPIKERFMNLGVSEIERPEGFPMNVDLDNSIESDSCDGYSISENSMYPSEDDSQQNISKSVKNEQATIKKPREPRGSKKNKKQKDNQGKAPANYKPDSKGSSEPSISEISESSVSESQLSSKRSDGCDIEILTGGSNPSESDFEESNSHFDYVPNEHTDSILGRFKTNTNDRSDYNLPQTPASHETLQHNQKLSNQFHPRPQRTSPQKPKKASNPSFKPSYNRIYQTAPSRFLTQATKPLISNSSRGIYKREIRKEETHQKEVTKETRMVNKPFLMKGNERVRCLNPAQRRDERLLHDPVTKLEKISECSTSEIKNLGLQQNGKIERNSKISNMTSKESNFELREKSPLNTRRNFDEESDKTGNHLLKDKPTSITSSQSTQEETKEDSPFSQKKTPQKSINKELPKIESPSIAPKTEEKQEKAFLIPSKGLRNPSLDCFFNASLQCLISASSFIKSFLSQTNLHDSLEEIEEEPTVTGKFKDFINTYFNSSDDVITAQELRASFVEDFPKNLQHDATWFILSLFQKLQEEHNKNVPAFKSSGHESSQAAWENYQKDHTSIIDQLFVGMNQNSFCCQKCRYGPKKYEEFNYIPVFFEEDQKNYKINFKNICSRREFSEFFCKKCKDITSCIIENKIVKFPQYLLLQIQISSMNSMEKRDELMKYEEKFSINIDKGKTKHYSLISVICYHKKFSSGHYESYCKRGDTWIYCCNSTIKEVDYPHNKKDAYILLYESK